ncbi:MAG: hypothetical protein KDJ86_19875 [Bauldia sp.]|uniref:hypothetical protein n=1 Tax=Bauldia sp. TaxID=2575872 RepID=UPI001DAB7861|nr:hypothetical protein [Bauldia sp.]MCB1498053.1 hypothetical protein [Bauldia sp.]
MSTIIPIDMQSVSATFRTTRKPDSATVPQTDAMRRLPFSDAAWPVWRSAMSRSGR